MLIPFRINLNKIIIRGSMTLVVVIPFLGTCLKCLSGCLSGSWEDAKSQFTKNTARDQVQQTVHTFPKRIHFLTNHPESKSYPTDLPVIASSTLAPN
jgi:hypothetical protein